MRLDGRAVILALWITLLITTLTSTITIDYYENTDMTVNADGLPGELRHAMFLVTGFWLAGLLSGAAASLLEWPEQERSAAASSFLGFGIGTFIRLLALGIGFLQGTEQSFWNFLSNTLTLHSIPDYHAFLLLVWIGGAVAVATGAMIGYVFKQSSVYHLPPLEVNNTVLTVTASLMSVIVLGMLVARNFETESRSDLTILDTKWLILPLTNMVVAALMGFFVGGGYFASNRFSAAVTVFLGAAIHVVVMLLLESYVSAFDATNEGTDLNNIPYLNFFFFWVGTPLVGAIAALALHNLREAFVVDYEDEEKAAI